MERDMLVYTIALPEVHERAQAAVDHFFPEVSVRSTRSAPQELPKLLTPTSDYESDAPRCNGVSQTSTISSLKVPRLEISGAPDASPRRENFTRRASDSQAASDAGSAVRQRLEPDLEGSGRSLLSHANDLDPAATVPRVSRLRARAPTVAVNQSSGDIEKLNLYEDNASVCRSTRSLNSSRSAPDRKISAIAGSTTFYPVDPFWQFRLRDIKPPKNPRLKKAGHYCRKIMTFMCSHVGLFLIVASYTALGGFIFPALENERALLIRQELHQQTHNLSVKLLDEVWKIGLELVTADQYLLEDAMYSICNHVMLSADKSDPKTNEERLADLQKMTQQMAQRSKDEDSRQHATETQCRERNLRTADDTRNGAGVSAESDRPPGGSVTDKFELFAIIWRARNRHRLKDRIETMVNEFRQQVYKQTVNGWDGRDTISRDTQWTFIGALLYTITVITTIGYGHMVPRTFEGRVVTIIYSLVGIPLTLLCVANMGGLFASCFRLIYLYVSELCCGESSLYKRWKEQRERRREEEDGNTVGSWHRNLTLRRAASMVRQAFKGIRARHMLNTSMAAEPKAGEQRSILTSIRKDGQRLRRRQKIRVPLSVTVFAICGYLLLGALLFSSTDSWELFDAFYFCYITLSTIGFGDFVPGTNSEEEGSQGKLALCSMYLICGLGMMSMTIQLMQDEVRLKVKRIGQHIGLVKTRRQKDLRPT